jgi:hypothetical protein
VKTTHVDHHVKSRSRRSRSRIALRLRLHQNDAALCGCGSATLPMWKKNQGFGTNLIGGEELHFFDICRDSGSVFLKLEHRMLCLRTWTEAHFWSCLDWLSARARVYLICTAWDHPSLALNGPAMILARAEPLYARVAKMVPLSQPSDMVAPCGECARGGTPNCIS